MVAVRNGPLCKWKGVTATLLVITTADVGDKQIQAIQRRVSDLQHLARRASVRVCSRTFNQIAEWVTPKFFSKAPAPPTGTRSHFRLQHVARGQRSGGVFKVGKRVRQHIVVIRANFYRPDQCCRVYPMRSGTSKHAQVGHVT